MTSFVEGAEGENSERAVQQILTDRRETSASPETTWRRRSLPGRIERRMVRRWSAALVESIAVSDHPSADASGRGVVWHVARICGFRADGLVTTAIAPPLYAPCQRWVRPAASWPRESIDSSTRVGVCLSRLLGMHEQRDDDLGRQRVRDTFSGAWNSFPDPFPAHRVASAAPQEPSLRVGG